MPERVFESEVVVPAPVEVVFPFFADAGNLAVITPRELRFEILTPGKIEMGVGTVIDYRLRIKGVPVRWRTRITVWEPGKRFVDEQVKGPYRQWIHEHTFEAVPGGTRMRDIVRYITPMDWLVHSLLVRPDIERIFKFRERVIHEKFAARAPSESSIAR